MVRLDIYFKRYIQRSFKFIFVFIMICIIYIQYNYQTIKEIKNTDIHEILRTPIIPDNSTWQRVSGTDIYVFSAFKLYLEQKIIRVIGLRKMEKDVDIYCQMWLKSDGEQVIKHTSVAIVEDIKEPCRDRRYIAVVITCPFIGADTPYSLSLNADKHSLPSNMLTVQTHEEPKLKRNFTICVKPMHSYKADINQVIEMVELNKILGIQKIYFYTYAVNQEVQNLLKSYEQEGIASVINWNIPIWTDSDIKVYGQLAAQNDCLYKNTGISKYVVFLDMDEFIVPQKENTLPELIQMLPSFCGCLVVKHTVFRKDWKFTLDGYRFDRSAVNYNIQSLLKLFREDFIYPGLIRSKNIVQPEYVQLVGIHVIIQFRSRGEYVYVVPGNALVFHYRTKIINNALKWRSPENVKPIKDLTMLRYKTKLINSVDKKWEKINHKQKLHNVV